MKKASMNDVVRVTGGASSSCGVTGYSWSGNTCLQRFQCKDKHGKVTSNYDAGVIDAYCKGK